MGIWVSGMFTLMVIATFTGLGLAQSNFPFLGDSAKMFDYLLNSTDYDKRMRPMPGGPNVSVEVEIELK